MNQAKEMARLAVEALEDKKAVDVRILDIGQISTLADYFIIASGNNRNQVQAMADNVDEVLAKAAVGEYGCFCIGGIIFLMAWFEYLRLDGMVINHLNDKKQKKKKKRHSSSDMADFVDEQVVSYSELEPGFSLFYGAIVSY